MAAATMTTAAAVAVSNPTSLSKIHSSPLYLRLPATAIKLRFFPTHHHNSSSSLPPLLKLTSQSSSKPFHHFLSSISTTDTHSTTTAATSAIFHGPCYVVGDNIDTDQIIPAEHLTLVPSKPDEYRKLGSFALVGLPSASYPVLFVEPGSFTTRFPIIVGGANFGCGSSREHAPVALGAAGVCAVVAESYARIFFRNSVATGEVYPVESEDVGLCKECSTGDIVTVDLSENVLINHNTGKQYKLKPIGDAGPVIEAGGIFAYARKAGMIPSATTD